MATLTGTITATGQQVDINVPTKRIPELSALPDPVDGNDLVAVYDTSENKTRQTPLSDLRDYFTTGGDTTPITPVVNGDELEVIVTDDNLANDGNGDPRRVLVPLLENEQFSLIRTGYGHLLTTQYNILPSGGFDLTDDDVRVGDIFHARIHRLSSGAGSGGAAATSIINGIAVISDDTAINTTHFNKLLHISSPTKSTIITLPDISTTPTHLIIPIETCISQGYWTKIQTQSGQMIYVSEAGQSSMRMGSNEFLWLLCGADGWYVMKASDSIFNVGQPFMDYVQRPNTLIARGQTVQRTLVPRVVDFLTANSHLVVSDADWNADWQKQGLFSWGDGSTTIRLPNHENRVYRALRYIGSPDSERSFNTPGNLQNDQVGQINITYKKGDGYTGSAENPTWFAPGQASNPQTPDAIEYFSGKETRMQNIGLLPLIRI